MITHFFNNSLKGFICSRYSQRGFVGKPANNNIQLQPLPFSVTVTSFLGNKNRSVVLSLRFMTITTTLQLLFKKTSSEKITSKHLEEIIKEAPSSVLPSELQTGWSWSLINVQTSYVNPRWPHTEPPSTPSPTPLLLTTTPKSMPVNSESLHTLPPPKNQKHH